MAATIEHAVAILRGCEDAAVIARVGDEYKMRVTGDVKAALQELPEGAATLVGVAALGWGTNEATGDRARIRTVVVLTTTESYGVIVSHLGEQVIETRPEGVLADLMTSRLSA